LDIGEFDERCNAQLFSFFLGLLLRRRRWFANLEQEVTGTRLLGVGLAFGGGGVD
jgi:hypothetical protein